MSALVLVSCGSEGAAETSARSVVVGGTSSPETPAATTTDVAGDAVLIGAVESVGTRYAFTATVELDGVETTRIVGSVYDGVGAYAVTSGSAVVDYVVGPEGQWAREPGSEWTTLAGPAPLVEPLASLAQPLAVTTLEVDGDNAIVLATYDGASLGFSSGESVDVTVTIIGGSLTQISYDARVGTRTALVVTTFDATADVAPIQVPPA